MEDIINNFCNFDSEALIRPINSAINLCKISFKYYGLLYRLGDIDREFYLDELNGSYDDYIIELIMANDSLLQLKRIYPVRSIIVMVDIAEIQIEYYKGLYDANDMQKETLINSINGVYEEVDKFVNDDTICEKVSDSDLLDVMNMAIKYLQFRIFYYELMKDLDVVGDNKVCADKISELYEQLRALTELDDPNQIDMLKIIQKKENN